ncbi:MAG: DUF885 family protein [Sphingopyxis sp.]|nr:DUF885 family protein [Sphingopyxis sp.]
MTSAPTLFDRRQTIAMMLATTAIGGCAATPAPDDIGTAQTRPDGTADVASLYDQLFDRMLASNPTGATSLGLDTGARAGLRSQLSSSAADSRFGFASQLVEARPALAAINPAGLSAQQRTYLAIINWFADRASEIVQTPYGGFEGYPIPYTLTQLTGSYQDVPDFLDSTHPVANAADAEAYLARMEAMVANIGHEVDRTEAEAAMGVIPPSYILTKTLTQTRNLRGQTGISAGMAAALARKTAAANIPGDWGRRAAAIIDGPMAASLDRQIAVLTALQGRSGTEAGVSRLPQGREFYATCLRQHTSTTLTAEEAHARGLEEVRDYESRLEPLLRAQGLTQGTVGARLTALGERPDQLWPNTDAGRAEMLAFCNERNDAVRPLLSRFFNNPPAAPLEIRRVPPAIEVGAPRGYAQRGSLDGTRPGAFYINLRDTRVWPRFAIPTFVYHEGIPGHVYQGAVVLASQSIPLLHRSLGIAAYGEGWALYAEQIADEMGLYDNEPLGRIGYLQAALYRAVRVVVDTGMHALGWSRERALRTMIETTGLAPSAAENEIDRYIVWPGQATSYKLGHSEIVRARAAAQRSMGNRFDLKAFHDVVLNDGSQPLELLSRNVAAWAAAPQS